MLHQYGFFSSAQSFLVIRTILRDSDLNFNIARILKITGLGSLDTIYFKRMSFFIFKTIQYLNWTAEIFLCKSYLNEGTPGKLCIFDSIRSEQKNAVKLNMLPRTLLKNGILILSSPDSKQRHTEQFQSLNWNLMNGQSKTFPIITCTKICDLKIMTN